MSHPITMPQLGLTQVEGTVNTWMKKPGDAVEKDEIILSVTTDKVDMDIESPGSGTLGPILVAEGETVPVGAVLGHIETKGAADTPAPPPAAPVQPQAAAATPGACALAAAEHRVAKPTAVEPTASEQVRASPRAKRTAKELGVDLSSVSGSGPDGQITEDDVTRAAAAARKPPAVAEASARRRQMIAAKMVESHATIPVFTLSAEVNAEKLVKAYGRLREAALGACKPTYTDLLLKATALALGEVPGLNSRWQDGRLHPHGQINVALAVDTAEGVVAPVIPAADRLSLGELTARRAALLTKCRSNQFSPADFGDAAGTLSNLGMFGVDSFVGLITPGQSFLLASGRLKNRPWAGETLSIKPTLCLNLSVDHRIADGASGARFLDAIVSRLEAPEPWLGAPAGAGA